LRIAPWFHQRRTIVTDSSWMNDTRTVECLISIDRQSAALRIGQRVQVTINPPAP
jgi:hypothetical protein